MGPDTSTKADFEYPNPRKASIPLFPAACYLYVSLPLSFVRSKREIEVHVQLQVPGEAPAGDLRLAEAGLDPWLDPSKRVRCEIIGGPEHLNKVSSHLPSFWELEQMVAFDRTQPISSQPVTRKVEQESEISLWLFRPPPGQSERQAFTSMAPARDKITCEKNRAPKSLLLHLPHSNPPNRKSKILFVGLALAVENQTGL